MKIILQMKYRNDEINMAHLFASCYTIDEERPNVFFKLFLDKSIAIRDKSNDKFSKRYGKFSNVISYFDWIFR